MDTAEVQADREAAILAAGRLMRDLSMELDTGDLIDLAEYIRSGKRGLPLATEPEPWHPRPAVPSVSVTGGNTWTGVSTS